MLEKNIELIKTRTLQITGRTKGNSKCMRRQLESSEEEIDA